MTRLAFHLKHPRPRHFLIASLALTFIGGVFWKTLEWGDERENTALYLQTLDSFFQREFRSTFYSWESCTNTLAGKVLTPGAQYDVTEVKDKNKNTLFTTNLVYRNFFKIKSMRFVVNSAENARGKGLFTVTFEPSTVKKLNDDAISLSREFTLDLERDPAQNNELVSCHSKIPSEKRQNQSQDSTAVSRRSHPIANNIYYNYKGRTMKKAAIGSAALIQLDDGGGDSGASKITFNDRGVVGYDGDRESLVLSAVPRIKGIVFDTSNGSNSFERMRITGDGRVAIGTHKTEALLTVAGAISTPPVSMIYKNAIDASASNIFRVTSINSPSIKLENMASGSQYTIIVEDPTSRTYEFPACSGEVFWSPKNDDTESGTRTIYKILVLRNADLFDCYINWTTGYN